MEFTQLKYFYTLAQNQHVTRTAEQLHIAQPSLTQSIRRLEKELDVKLFKNSGRTIVLTDCGKYLQRKIEPLLKTLDEIPEEIRALTGDRQKTIKINVLAASTLITETIINYQKKHPEIRFQIVQNTETENADITIFTRDFFQRPLATRDNYYIFSEEIFLAVPGTSHYATKKTSHSKSFRAKILFPWPEQKDYAQFATVFVSRQALNRISSSRVIMCLPLKI